MPDRNKTVRLENNDYRYLVRVRRLAVGEYFPALLPNGEETLIQVTSIEHNTLTGICSAAQRIPGKEKGLEEDVLPPILLFQALPKADKMDLIVRQSAESGITEIVPFVSEFSVAKTDASGQKFSRWERIIKEARQQSGSKIMTAIRRPLMKEELFSYWNKIKTPVSPALLFHHSRGVEQKSLHSYLNNVTKCLSCKQIVALVIGPEGGFSEAEVSIFLENGFNPFTIGDTILRTETAALYCTAAVKILLLERDSWELSIVKNHSV
jgi:16S rRNA (uracil1498-N3)-methyltransferase